MSDASLPEASSSSYGPIRRRVSGKDGPFALWRPPQTSQDDFVEIMKEVVPQLLDTVIQDEGSSGGVKRSPSVASLPTADEPATQRARIMQRLRHCRFKSVVTCGPLLPNNPLNA